EKALSEPFGRLRFRDTSLLIWQQQQQELQVAPPSTYLSRSQSAWYSSYGNPAVLVRDKRGLEDSEGRSRICSVM
uniref:Si:ch1073-363c19.3 n=1 Tax=Stegastes partitus TaxID=144197 RepID=A0A3B5ARI9_9TELE